MLRLPGLTWENLPLSPHCRMLPTLTRMRRHGSLWRLTCRVNPPRAAMAWEHRSKSGPAVLAEAFVADTITMWALRICAEPHVFSRESELCHAIPSRGCTEDCCRYQHCVTFDTGSPYRRGP